jgi:hypothetical protein
MLIRQASINIHNFKVRLKGAERRLHNPLSERNRALIAELRRSFCLRGYLALGLKSMLRCLER